MRQPTTIATAKPITALSSVFARAFQSVPVLAWSHRFTRVGPVAGQMFFL